MQKFNARHYVPVLYTKAGERWALKEIEDADKDRFTPLFVVPPIPLDPDDGNPVKTSDDHLGKLPARLAVEWGSRPTFIDGYHVMDEVMADGRAAIEWILDEAMAAGLPLVPVVSPRHCSSAYVTAVQRRLARDETGEVCLRLWVDEWPGLHDGSVGAFLDGIGVSLEETHLVLDLGDDTSPAAAIAMSSTLTGLPDPWRWKTVTVTATAMPAGMPSSGAGVDVIERQEWINYQSMVVAQSYGARRPTFGDYAVTNPAPLGGVNPRVLQIRAKIKYTAGDTWVVSKGDLYSGTGGPAIWPAAQQLVSRPEYTPGHCGAESWIDAAAGKGPHTGNPTTWVKIGTWHHVLRVLDQV